MWEVFLKWAFCQRLPNSRKKAAVSKKWANESEELWVEESEVVATSRKGSRKRSKSLRQQE